jgi:O-antigen/teichoic acid export membrane protein
MPSSAGAAPHLTVLTVRGLFWNYLSLFATKAGGLVTTIVTSRILTPAEFGLVAYTSIAVDLLGMVKDVGLGTALIQRRDDDASFFETAYSLNLASGVVLTLVAVLAAPLVAAWAEEPSVVQLLRVLALTFVLDAFGAVHVVALRRHMDFRRKLIVDGVRSLVKLVVAVAGALAGYGAWALVASAVVGSLASSIIAWWRHPWRPRLTLHLGRARDLLLYGGPLAMADALGVILSRVELLVVGSWFGASALGLFAVADRIPSFLAGNLLWVTTGVMFPAYSRIQRERERLSEALLDTVRFSSMAFVPLALGLALMSESIVLVVLGPQWSSAVTIVRVLALSALLSLVPFHMGDALKSLGLARVVLGLASIDVAVFVSAAAAGAVTFGLLGVAFGRLVASGVSLVVRATVTLRILKLPVFDLLRALAPAAAGAAVLTLVVESTLRIPVGRPILQLTLAMVAGAPAYAATLWLVDRQSIRLLTRRTFRRRRPSAPIAKSAASG